MLFPHFNIPTHKINNRNEKRFRLLEQLSRYLNIIALMGNCSPLLIVNRFNLTQSSEYWWEIVVFYGFALVIQECHENFEVCALLNVWARQTRKKLLDIIVTFRMLQKCSYWAFNVLLRTFFIRFNGHILKLPCYCLQNAIFAAIWYKVRSFSINSKYFSTNLSQRLKTPCFKHFKSFCHRLYCTTP